MSDQLDEWRENRCENSVRVNGCADEGPYYDVPWGEGPGITVFTEEWCSECIEEVPGMRIEGDEVVMDTSDNDYIPLDEIHGSKIDGVMNEEELIEAHEEDELLGPADDRLVIRTDDGLIHAKVTESDVRPEDLARLSGAEVEADDPAVHYVDYHREET